MAMDMGTENEQRASLEVLGQANSIERNDKNGAKSAKLVQKNHKNHNMTEDVKARFVQLQSTGALRCARSFQRGEGLPVTCSEYKIQPIVNRVSSTGIPDRFCLLAIFRKFSN